MLQPKRLKHRKFQRGRMKGAAQRGNRITKGDYALKAMEPCWMTARQIEAARRAVTHHFKRGGAVWINVFPDKPVTKKPAEVRMGSGRGAPGARHPRGRRRQPRARERGAAACGLQAPDQNAVHRERGGWGG